MDTPKAPKNKGGRPFKIIDVPLLDKLAAIHCTNEEMGAVLGCSADTLERRYAGHIKEGRAKGKMSLKRKMWEMALSGNVSLLIWLSKNELGWYDQVKKVEIEDPAKKARVDEMASKLLGISAERPKKDDE